MLDRSVNFLTNFHSKPSIFEVVASESLQATFRPAWKRLIQFIVKSNPVRFKFMGRYSEEMFTIIDLAINHHYLFNYGGSISEVFYGITRNSPSVGRLTRKYKWLSLFLVSILPYMHIKLKEHIAKLKLQQDLEPDQIKKNDERLMFSYSALMATYDCFTVWQYLMYLSSDSQSHTPLLWLFGIRMNHMPPIDGLDWTLKDLLGGKIKLASIFSGFVFRSLELSMFFLQFLQWWQTEKPGVDVVNMKIPKLPPKLEDNADKYQGICPICLQTWNIPTALSISGYVFCYGCIANHLQKYSCCPVTQYPASIEDLIRIYDD